MEKLIECVPNFSEGRDKKIIDQITDAITSVEGVRLLDVDMGYEMNRTVVTFTGNPEGIKEAAFLAVKTASELIDMTKQKGSHPRMGATDVCPFIPVANVTEEECIRISKEVAERVGNELGIPVYLYEKSAAAPGRKNLAVIRSGEYEGFAEKIKLPEWKPDFGPAKLNLKSGATVMGAREFLIAYNINLNTREKSYATDIAFMLREKGRSARSSVSSPFYNKSKEILKYEPGSYPSGMDDFTGKSIEETIRYCKDNFGYDLVELLKLNDIDPEKPEGESVKIPGKFKNCKAIGWFVPEFDRAQISINLTDFHITSMHHVIEEARKLAAERGLVVTGSEIVGMVPYQALIETGKFYLKMQGRSTGIPAEDILKTAIQSLGLNDLYEFKIDEKVLGLPSMEKYPLISKTVSGFADEVSRETPAPGGGSVAALSGSLGSALVSMVSNLTFNKKSSPELREKMEQTASKAQELKDQLLLSVDNDTNAFNEFMSAKKLPGNTPEELEIKNQALLTGLKKAASVPLETAELCLKSLELSLDAAELGNKSSITDAGVGAQCAFSGVNGAIYNVLINLKNIDDSSFNDEIRIKCRKLKNDAEKLITEVEKLVRNEIGD